MSIIVEQSLFCIGNFLFWVYKVLLIASLRLIYVFGYLCLFFPHKDNTSGHKKAANKNPGLTDLLFKILSSVFCKALKINICDESFGLLIVGKYSSLQS